MTSFFASYYLYFDIFNMFLFLLNHHQVYEHVCVCACVRVCVLLLSRAVHMHIYVYKLQRLRI